jgi:hypothetical protein
MRVAKRGDREVAPNVCSARRRLRKELVESKQITNTQFHDEILRQGSMPIALVRLALTKEKLTRDMNVDWKFDGDRPSK